MKVATVLNKELPIGLIANASAVLGISLGRLFPESSEIHYMGIRLCGTVKKVNGLTGNLGLLR